MKQVASVCDKMVVSVGLRSCHNRGKRRLSSTLARRVSTSLREFLRRLEAETVNAFHLTMRAADKWDSPRFLGIWLAWSFFCSRTLFTLHPLAANAGRSAAYHLSASNETHILFILDSLCLRLFARSLIMSALLGPVAAIVDITPAAAAVLAVIQE